MGGADKGLLPLGGQALVARVIERLRPQVGPLLVSANRNLETYRAFGFPVVTDADQAVDLEPFPGPLAGVLAGLHAARTPWLAAVPCDAPLLPLDLVGRLAAAVGTAPAAMASVGGRAEPLFCLLRVALAADLATALARGERSAVAWLRGAGAVPVAFADPAEFANLNTPQAL
jgi:molybdopterin-guanine dinucleotide biosynthesis protein A